MTNKFHSGKLCSAPPTKFFPYADGAACKAPLYFSLLTAKNIPAFPRFRSHRPSLLYLYQQCPTGDLKVTARVFFSSKARVRRTKATNLIGKFEVFVIPLDLSIEQQKQTVSEQNSRIRPPKRITCLISNSNVSRPEYNSAVVARSGCFAAIVEGKV